MHAQTFAEFPPRQAPANFNQSEMLATVLSKVAGGIAN
jgi:hypothetical protein